MGREPAARGRGRRLRRAREAEPANRRSRTGHQNIGLPGLALLAVVCVAFFLRAAAGSLPSLEPREKLFLQDENGEPYLTEMDSYFYLRKAREMDGQDGQDGAAGLWAMRSEDPLIGPVRGERSRGISNPLGLSALAFWLWKHLLSAFGLTLAQTAARMGPALGSLAAVPAFFYVRRRTSLAGGVAAGLLVGCALPLTASTHAGFFDTDMVLALLPTVAVLAQARCLQEAALKRQLPFALLSAASVAALSLFWQAWYVYLALIPAGTACAVLLHAAFARRGAPRGSGTGPVLRGGLLFLPLASLMLLLFGGGEFIRQAPGMLQAFRAMRGPLDAMPDPYAMVAEMQPLRLWPRGGLLSLFRADFRSLTGQLGGLIPCLLALLCFPAALLRSRKKAGPPAAAPALCAEAGLLGLWLAAGLFLAAGSSRFARIAVLPAGLLGGLGVGHLSLRAEERWRGKAVRWTVCALLAVLPALPAFLGSLSVVQAAVPSVTDCKAEAMAFIRDETPQDASVVSWWDDGYYIEYEAQRRTLADGGTDSGALYWFLCRALLSDDPDLSAGICRMLGESGTEALDRLTEYGTDQPEAAALLLRILPMDRAAAADTLRGLGLPEDIADLTHPAITAPRLLVLNTEMLGKYRSYGYFARWNPRTGAQEGSVFILPSAASAAAEDGRAALKMTDERYTVFLREAEDGTVSAEYTDRGTARAPGRLRVWEDGRLVLREDGDGDALAAVIIREGGRYCALLCSADVCDSLLIRLLACEDEGTGAAVRLGTWYGDPEAEPCAAQMRIGGDAVTSRAVQVWRLTGGD